jgi:hypothetical protein
VTRAWNWKAAVVSSLCRAAIFFATNVISGVDAALAAAQVEFVYRAIASGFYGSLTDYFSRMRPARAATLAALVIIPGIAHTIEYLIHSWAGTPRLGASVLASIAFSVATTRFNLFAMRRGFLITGRGSHSLLHDLRGLTRLCATGVALMARGGLARRRLRASR